MMTRLGSLYPFMTAVVNGLKLDVIYTLVSANPMIISGGIKLSPHKVYLKAKLEASQKQVEALKQENEQKEQELVALRKENASLKCNVDEGCPTKRSASACHVRDAKRAHVMSKEAPPAFP